MKFIVSCSITDLGPSGRLVAEKAGRLHLALEGEADSVAWVTLEYKIILKIVDKNRCAR
jgi:hypothetical protein